jgi:hypothetical protein
MNPSFAQAQPLTMHPGDAGYEVVLEAATAPLRESLGERVELEVERMDRIGDWAFVLGNMRAPGGGRPDLSGTRFEEASGQGSISDLYVALLRREATTSAGGRTIGDAADAAPGASPAAPAAAAARDQAGIPAESGPAANDAAFPTGGTWTVLDHAIGPGDVAWLDWPQEHAAPRALFGF